MRQKGKPERLSNHFFYAGRRKPPLPGANRLFKLAASRLHAAMNGSTIHRGLEGVVVDSTRISKVMPEINALVYFGYPVQELAEQCSFEEVAWLLWHGELPNARELAEFQKDERSRRNLTPELLSVLQKVPLTAHP